MRLMNLSLKNIRSYEEAEIDFSEGSTLLAGDIGSGKSTILLALEFALFGIQRGELSGASLLRHGCRHGEVRLTLEIEKREVTIVRSLKRANSVTQEVGSITIDGVMTEGTARELKAKVFELLNYPSSLLSKGRRPLFRYTVYTPQEEMKAIIYERADERLDTLRKLFDIDKYRRVRENALNLIKEQRKEETELAARIDELDKQLTDCKSVESELSETTKRAKGITQELTAATTAYEEARERVEKQEKERFRVEELKKRLALAKNKEMLIRRRIEETERDEKEVTKQLESTDLTRADVDEEKLAEHEHLLATHEAKIKEKEGAITRQEAEQQAIIKQARSVMANISRLDDCPTCKQPVTLEHKTHINEVEGKRIAKAEERIKKLDSLKGVLAEKRSQLEKKQQELRQKQLLVAANREKLRSLELLKKRIIQLTTARVHFLKECEEERELATKIAQELDACKGIDLEAYQQLKRIVEERREALTKAKVAAAEIRKDIERLEKERERARKQRLERKEYTKRLKMTQQRLAWLNKHLLNVAHAIEKAMFTSLHGHFNEYFKEWFNTLLEDETLSVRLDAEFTPIITQNGYETSIEHLSGGEKTSIALAYRLSLNKVINDFLSGIKTHDLLILDEPTDGFSSEQLDRVREVLDQLKLKQVLIVSHEAQMEGYVDHILRVEKWEHESRIS